MKIVQLTERITVQVPDDTNVDSLYLDMAHEDFRFGALVNGKFRSVEGAKVTCFATESVEPLTDE